MNGAAASTGSPKPWGGQRLGKEEAPQLRVLSGFWNFRLPKPTGRA